MKKEEKVLVDDLRKKALEKSDDDVLSLTDEELLSMNPMTEFDDVCEDLISLEDMNYFYELKDKLSIVQREMKEVLKEIAEDTKTFEDSKVTWLGDEKTEWQHDLSSKRLWFEELRQKQNELRRQIYALTKGKTHGRGKK